MFKNIYTKYLNHAGYAVIMIDNLETERRKYQEDKTNLSVHLKNLEVQHQKLQEDKTGLNRQLENLKRNKREYQEEKIVLNRQLENLEKQNRKIQEDKTDLGRQLENLETQNQMLQEDKTNLGRQLENLETQNQMLQEDKTNLGRQIEALCSERDQLLQERNNLHKEREEMRQEMESLRRELDSLAQENEEIVQGNFERMLQNPETTSVFVNKITCGALGRHHRSVFWGDRLLTLDKAAGFYEEDKFKDCHSQINQPQNYDQYAGPDGIAWRLNTLVWAAKCALNLPGDFVECGVFKGDMSWVVTNVIDWAQVDKTFYLYDTFEGFSSKYTSQEDFPFNPKFLDFANKVYQIPGLYEQVCERFKEFSNVKIIKGVLPDALDEESPEKIAFLHIDLNSVKPEIGVLEVLFDCIVSGGIVIFDDYGWLEYARQKRAEDVFMGERGYSIMELPTGQGLVVKR